MAVPEHKHRFTIGGGDFTGFAEPYTPKADETPPAEALTVKAYWRVLVDAPDAVIVADAAIEDIETLGGTAIETGPLYIRQVIPWISDEDSDHVEIRAVAYREES